jgi:predicted alpha-1,2-mannosidase
MNFKSLTFTFLCIYFPFGPILAQKNIPPLNYSQYVNPFIGTGGHGHTFPGAVLPFGMVQLSPDTRVDNSWDGCSGYHYSDSVIYGFSHTHLSGTGVTDWGDIMIMPMIGKPFVDNKIYSSKFSHSKEKASPGYYEVFLEDDKINVGLTVTPRVGIHKYNFPSTNEANIILDLLHRDKLLNGNFKVLDSITVVGYRISEAWAKEQHCYFVMKFSQPLKKVQYARDKKYIPVPDDKKNEYANAGIFQFVTKENKPLLVKVAISSVNIDGALANLNEEAKGWDFEKYKTEAENTWNKQFQKIIVTDKDKDKLAIFYSALYHCSIHPSLNMDVDNNYRGRDNKIHTANGFTNYSVFSLWDTYRALHPLFTIIERKRTGDFLNTFMHQFDESKRLPVWELSSNETDCMIGYHAVSVIADAFAKGIGVADTNIIYDAVKAAASYTRFGIPAYNKKNYLSVEDESESVSRTLEYAYDDWCIAQLAQKLNKSDDYSLFMKKAQSYKNVFDVNSGFIRPRKNGNWLIPFDPKEVNNHFTEGNSWQYSFYAPHDIQGLINLYGSSKKFEDKLDSLFNTGSKTSGREQADITGLIGQYAHGNEPSHHMAYLYNYVGKPYKTQDKISQIMNEFYKNSPDGLIGNEDCGQMSAWYVFSALGFYPVCPGSVNYVIGTPMFNSAEINLENGNKFLITKKNNTGESKYIKSLEINQKSNLRSALSHEQIIRGGSLTFLFDSKTDTSNKFGTGYFHRPLSKNDTRPLLGAPVIVSQSKSFEGKQSIRIEANSAKVYNIAYTTNGKEPTKESPLYFKPFFIDTTCIIKAKIYFEKDSSTTTEAFFFKKPNNWKITLTSKYSQQYSAGGDEGIIDGIYGDLNWKKGEWQGYQKQDFECVIDMKEKKQVNSISLNFLQDTRAWIIFPTLVNIYVSSDNIKYALVDSIGNTVEAKDYSIQIKKFEKNLAKKQTARYVKFVAKNFGALPEWHDGKGGDAYIFIDEIEIK